MGGWGGGGVGGARVSESLFTKNPNLKKKKKKMEGGGGGGGGKELLVGVRGRWTDERQNDIILTSIRSHNVIG